MTQTSEIATLSDLISSYVTDLESYLSSQGFSSPSFSIDTIPAYPLTPELAFRREKALAAIDDLKALIEGPQAGANIGFQALARYGVLNHIKLGEEVSYEDLAQRCNLDVSTLRRVMRSLIAIRIFCEPRKGFVAHSPTSKILVEHPPAYRWLEFVYEEIWPSTTKAVDAMTKWPGSEEPNHTGFSLSRNQPESFWDTVPTNPVRSSRFSDAMRFLFSAPAFSSDHLIRGLNWDQNECPKVVVDVGGSSGVIAGLLLRTFPLINKVIVQDLPGIVESASVPSDLEHRLELMTHDFLTPQPVVADAYLLRLILHDWSDKYAGMIIKNLIPALKPGARIVINDMCLPEPGHLSKHHEQKMRASKTDCQLVVGPIKLPLDKELTSMPPFSEFDLVMKANFNSKERDAEEWISLFSTCDSRFRSTGIKKTPGSPLAVMEFVWDQA